MDFEKNWSGVNPELGFDHIGTLDHYQFVVTFDLIQYHQVNQEDKKP